MSDQISRMFDPPSPGAQTIEDLRELVAEIKGAENGADKPEMADDAARLAGQLLADLDELVSSLPRGQWGADELGTLANWLGEHGYDIGDEDDDETAEPDDIKCGLLDETRKDG